MQGSGALPTDWTSGPLGPVSLAKDDFGLANAPQYEPSASVGRTVVLDADGDQDPDLAMVRGDAAFLIEAPAYHEAFVPLDSNALEAAEDLAVLVGGAPGWSWDALLYPNAAGLQMAWLDQEALTFSTVSLDEPGKPWAGALQIEVGDVDGDKIQDAVGIRADGTTLLIKRGLPGGAWAPTVLHPSTRVAIELKLLHWDAPLHSPGVEIAIDSHDGLSVYDGKGAELAHLPSWNAMHDALGVLPRGPGQAELLAWSTRDHTDTHMQLLLVERGPTGAVQLAEAALDLASREPESIAAADVDGDGQAELALLLHNPLGVWVLHNQSGEGRGYFEQAVLLAPDASSFLPLAPFGTPTTAGAGDPVLADFDGNGTVDLACGTDFSGKLAMFTQGVLAPQGLPGQVILGDIDYDLALVKDQVHSYSWDAVVGHPLELNAELVFLGETPQPGLLLDVLVWSQPGPLAPVGEVALQHNTIPVQQLERASSTDSLPLELVLTPSSPLEIFWVEVQAVIKTPQIEPLGERLVFSYSPTLGALGGIGPVEDGWDLALAVPNEDPGGDPQKAGGIISLRRIRGFQPHVHPRRGQ